MASRYFIPALCLSLTIFQSTFAQTERSVEFMIMGLKADQQSSLRSFLKKTSGITGVADKAVFPTGLDLRISTNLKNDMLLEAVEARQPNLSFDIMTETQQVVMISVTKPGKGETAGVTNSGERQRELRDSAENDVQRKMLAAPPPTAIINTQSVEDDDSNKTFTKVEWEAEFPGGPKAFAQYLADNLDGTVPKKNGAPAGTYRAFVRFIVHKDGTISDVESVSKIDYGMAAEAVRVIRKSPH